MDSFDLLDRRRRHQRRGDRARRGRARARRAAGREGRSRRHTSSASSKLIHGGLRYLEHYEFRLVRESLHEREILLRTAPHIVRPLRVRPARSARRPALVDDPRSACSSTTCSPAAAACPARAASAAATTRSARRSSRGFRLATYWDAWVDDARLVVLNALDAARARRRDRHPHRIALRPPRRRRLDAPTLSGGRNVARAR